MLVAAVDYSVAKYQLRGYGMPDYDKLLQLPFEIIWPLAAGYLAYRLAFIGRDAPHKAFDAVFLVFVFGTAAKGTAALTTIPADSWFYPVATLLGLSVSLATAWIWRTWGAPKTFEMFRRKKVLDHDGQPDVWRSMMSRTLSGPVQLTVATKAEKIYLCDELARFNTAPLGPCLFGEDGSIAMYITAWKQAGDAEWHDVNPHRQDVGLEMSFFKASDIERVDITRLG